MHKTLAYLTLKGLVEQHKGEIYSEALECLRKELVVVQKPAHNIDYTAALENEIASWCKCGPVAIHVLNANNLATRLNSVVKAKQNCA